VSATEFHSLANARAKWSLIFPRIVASCTQGAGRMVCNETISATRSRSTAAADWQLIEKCGLRLVQRFLSLRRLAA